MLNTAFFNAVRGSLYPKLTQTQVDGLNAIAAAWAKHGDGDRRKLAYIMATAHHETGGAFGPRVENLNYTSASRIRAVWPTRFTLATALDYVRQPQKLANKVYGGRLGNVRPNDGWTYRGRGLAQITGRENYAKFARLLGVDIEASPDKALDVGTAAAILVIGSVRGLFTGRALVAGVPDYRAARAVINADGKANGALIAGYAEKFEAALKVGWSTTPAKKTGTQPGSAPPATSTNWLSDLLAAIAAFFVRNRST